MTLAKPDKRPTAPAARPRGTVSYMPRQIAAAGRSLREAILAACEDFEESLRSGDKDYLRALHTRAKAQEPGMKPEHVRALFGKYKDWFRNGSEIDPSKIKPVLHLVNPMDHWRDLFMISRSLWSMPYNKGYGRRLRFVVVDQYHKGVMGIIGLQSPPADLQVRDQLFDYLPNGKLSAVNCTMDAFSVGAVPPYTYLLGGKLCAGLISSDSIRQAYWRQYAGKKTLMGKDNIRQPLAAVTTTGAFGRSSMYNRLRYGDRLLAEPIGYTLGYGTLHLEHLYSQIRDYLDMTGQYNNGGFGMGPKARWQNICNALTAVGLSNQLLRHGVKREVFMFRLVEDLERGMAGGKFGKPIKLSVRDFSDYWLERWALPRAHRFPEWNQGDERQLIANTLASIA